MTGRHVWQGASVAGGVHGRGACMAGGMCGRGTYMAGEACVAGGACMAGETASAVGGMHPTGMHSC